MSVVKTGVTFKKDLLSKLDRYMRETGIQNRSKIIGEALEIYLAERSILMSSGKISGAILVYFDHEAEEELTRIQHDYLDIIISNTHAHLDRENCIEAILVKGSVEKVKKLVSNLERIKEVKAVRYGFFRIE